MSTSIATGHVNEVSEAELRHSVYSPASSYSTYSHEVKYIFDPVEDSGDEYTDYSQISSTARVKHSFHTPRTLSSNSHTPVKENQTPLREDMEASQHLLASSVARTNSTVSSRGPLSPRVEEVVYSTSHYANGHRKHPAAPPEHVSRERSYYSPVGELPPYPYAKHSYPAWKNNNVVNNYNNIYSPPHPTKNKNSNLHPDLNRQNRNGAAAPQLNSFHNHHPLSGVNNHYPPAPPTHGNEPPYPCPPRYNHQQHQRRKTWSPPALKMSLLSAAVQGSRVCYSNDSLDFNEDTSIERKTQSLSDDLDVTPPRLAPISGVLAQKPGPNLIKPIAFKPVQMSPNNSPVGQLNRRTSAADDTMNGPHEINRPHGMKLGVSMLGVRGSPDSSHNSKSNIGAFNSMTKSHQMNHSGQHFHSSSSDHHPGQHFHSSSSDHHPGQHFHSSSSDHHPSSVNNSHNSSQHSSGSCHNISSGSYSNLPGNSQNSANSSRLSGGDDNSFSNEFPKGSDWPPDSTPSANPSRVSSHGVEGVLQTPSPSDSGVGELEAILREKDAEINTLREVMDRNERAIFQVYEERRHLWLQDTQELRDEYERKLKIQSRKSYKTEQVLSLQVYKLQQEQKVLQEEKSKVSDERDFLRQQVDDQSSEISQLRQSLDSLTSGNEPNSVSTNSENLSVLEELALKNKELITVKSHLHSFELDMDKKNKEIADKVREISSKTDQLKTLKEELLRLKNPPVLVETASQTHAPSEVALSENMKPSMLGERDRTINSLQDELLDIRAQLNALKEEHEKEREQWLDEKNKVVRYQKQLQLNYVQMQRKNSTLESEVQQLTLELESRDMKLIALDEESMC